MKEPRRAEPPRIEICILAGGLSTRMGRDKAKVRLGGRSLLRRIKQVAAETGAPVRVIRKDAVPRCGPLGGMLTALVKSKADAILFLTCDMPLISADLLGIFLKSPVSEKPLFTRMDDRWGFPLVIPVAALAAVRQQIERRQFSVQRLGKILNARVSRIPTKYLPQLINVNSPGDLERARVVLNSLATVNTPIARVLT